MLLTQHARRCGKCLPERGERGHVWCSLMSWTALLQPGELAQTQVTSLATLPMYSCQDGKESPAWRNCSTSSVSSGKDVQAA